MLKATFDRRVNTVIGLLPHDHNAVFLFLPQIFQQPTVFKGAVDPFVKNFLPLHGCGLFRDFKTRDTSCQLYPIIMPDINDLGPLFPRSGNQFFDTFQKCFAPVHLFCYKHFLCVNHEQNHFNPSYFNARIIGVWSSPGRYPTTSTCPKPAAFIDCISCSSVRGVSKCINLSDVIPSRSRRLSHSEAHSVSISCVFAT